MPEELGGGSVSGDGVADLALVAELVGKTVAPGPLHPVSTVLAGLVEAPDGHEDTIESLVSGELVASWAVYEPGKPWSPLDPRSAGDSRPRRRAFASTVSRIASRRAPRAACCWWSPSARAHVRQFLVPIPPVLDTLPASRVIHSTQYLPRMADLDHDLPYRVAVIGGAQSAAEVFRAIQQDLPNSDMTWVMRSIGPSAYETGRFNNELYYPSAVDDFFHARPEGQEQILREMHRTNYSGVEPDLLESLYHDFYLNRIGGYDHRRMITLTDVTAAREQDGEVVLELTDRRTGDVSALPVDLVFTGTGFVRQMPRMVGELGTRLGLAQLTVSRSYRLHTGEPSTAACYLQGLNEDTHGIADTLLSVLATRASDAVADILAHRSSTSAQLNGHYAAAGAGPDIRVPVAGQVKR